MTENALVPVVEVDPRVSLGVIRADGPKELVRVATEAADALRGVISAKKLFSTISGREYVRVEGWTTLATMMGCLPREVSVTRDEKGTYTATVELVRMHDQAVLTRASAECGMDEPTWAKRADYARRSMAVTRATSKACRIAFSWVMVLAGYEPTPSEEIPDTERGGAVSRAPRGQRGAAGPGPGVVGVAPTIPNQRPTAAELSYKPLAIVAEQSEVMPWAAELKWKDKPLKDFASKDLITLRDFCEKKDPKQYAPYLTAIEELLASRDGE